MWKQYQDLYAGGEQLRANASEYLVRRHKEPGEVYGERLSRVFYENYIGSIIDWYAATLMRREPVLLFEGHDAAAKAFLQPAVGRLRPEGHEPAASSSGSDSCRRWCAAAVTWWWTFRGQERRPADAGGGRRLRAFASLPGGLQRRRRSSTGTTTRRGGLEWAVIRTSCLQQSKVTDAKWERETRWIYYDRENFQIYRKAGEDAADRADRRGAARAGGAAAGAAVRVEGIGGAVADEQGGPAATGALQQVERAGVGADDGAVRHAGGLLGPGVEPDCGRILLHPTRHRTTGSGGRSRRARSTRLRRTTWCG